MQKQALADLAKQRPDLCGAAEKRLEKGEFVRSRYKKERKAERTGTLTKVTPRRVPQRVVAVPKIAPESKAKPPSAAADFHAQDIRALKPTACRSLLIDETGEAFSVEAEQLTENDRQLGRWVGLLIPDTAHGLPPLSRGWHAVEQSDPAEIDRVFQCVMASW